MSFVSKLIILAIISSIGDCFQSSDSNETPIIFPDDSEQPNTNPVVNNPVKCKPKDCHTPNVCYLYLNDETPVGQCLKPDGTKGVCCEPDVKIIGKDFERK